MTRNTRLTKYVVAIALVAILISGFAITTAFVQNTGSIAKKTTVSSDSVDTTSYESQKVQWICTTVQITLRSQGPANDPLADNYGKEPKLYSPFGDPLKIVLSIPNGNKLGRTDVRFFGSSLEDDFLQSAPFEAGGDVRLSISPDQDWLPTNEELVSIVFVNDQQNIGVASFHRELLGKTGSQKSGFPDFSRVLIVDKTLSTAIEYSALTYFTQQLEDDELVRDNLQVIADHFNLQIRNPAYKGRYTETNFKANPHRLTCTRQKSQGD